MLSVFSKTTDKDMGAKRIREAAKAIDGASIVTGLFAGDTHPDSDLPLAVIGAIQEFGSVEANIPARPWISRAVREKESDWQSAFGVLISSVIVRGGSIRRELIKLGNRVAKDVRKTIDRVSSPPNAPSTIARKGFNNPLRHRDVMRDSTRSHVTVEGITTKGVTGPNAGPNGD